MIQEPVTSFRFSLVLLPMKILIQSRGFHHVRYQKDSFEAELFFHFVCSSFEFKTITCTFVVAHGVLVSITVWLLFLPFNFPTQVFSRFTVWLKI